MRKQESVHCQECDQDLTKKIQVYDWAPDKKSRVVRCEVCNVRVGKGEEVVKVRLS